MRWERTTDRARGRWREILPVLGVGMDFLSGAHGPCPACGGKDRFRFDDRRKEGDYFCSGCGAGTGLTLLMKVRGWNFKTAAEEVDKLLGKAPVIYREQSIEPKPPDKAELRRLWMSSKSVEQGDAVSQYLVNRGIVGLSIPSCLRTVPEMRFVHRDGHSSMHPGMLALFTAPNGRPNTLHRTYLTDDGKKAELDPCRRFMPGRIAKGGAVRLCAAGEWLGIAEGIETALSAMMVFDIPVWAALNEGLLRAWCPPPGVKHVMVFGDNDQTFVGQHAAYDLAKRLVRDGPVDEVRVRIPLIKGHDWNDRLQDGMAQSVLNS
jgi:putative DNA primase/helicase